jgi:hypothetical protein
MKRQSMFVAFSGDIEMGVPPHSSDNAVLSCYTNTLTVSAADYENTRQ